MNTAPTNYALVTALQEDYRMRAEHHRFVTQNRAETEQNADRRRAGPARWLSHARLSMRGEETVV